MESLPTEIIYIIFEYLPYKEIRNFRRLSSYYDDICTKMIQQRSSVLLKLYKDPYKIKINIYCKLDELIQNKYYVLDFLDEIKFRKKLMPKAEVKFLLCYNHLCIQEVIKFCETLV